MAQLHEARLVQRSQKLLWRRIFSALVVGGAISAAVCAETQVSLAQKTSALPPPPDVDFDLVPVPSKPVPQSPASPETPREYIYKAPPAAKPNSSKPINVRTTRYMVYVNGNSPYLLQQIRLVEPDAFVQTFQGEPVIQVGMFDTEQAAQAQSKRFADYGLKADVATVEISAPSGEFSDRGYVVVIPSRQTEFASLTSQLTRLGIPEQVIQAKLAPIAPHLQLGPYRDRQDAEFVSRSLRRNGLDARLYFSR
ncbi:MAG TPA: hypothetical protein IGS53_25100 [Leptolyngbyaceae cyanobacterium M33_DOE_097]|uniref:SPOR domain-containing protein n=1 Tax=Oscillatoriales cyanobacterium SpSt-418 TaxID=2282169 RepID=A0A7C3KIQ5_9CYAN|nr:hypothetical protein [Leptolyngbyaceae cyanobacterium M33_DOE_097]